ncbi:MAG: penicillin acylase family protein [Bacteroidota bacterium]
MKYWVAVFLLFYVVVSQAQPEHKRLKDRAQNVTIIRDKWGVPHIYAKTDADVVFGLLYAQCEDDFARVEWNYIDALGRTAEIEGESALYSDLRSRLFHDSTRAKDLYKQSKPEMKKLMDAFADGVNYYLLTHQDVKPKLLHKFHAWYPLLFSEGSIGGDLTSISIPELKAFYENERKPEMEINEPVEPKEPKGSNGFAIAPSRSESGHALLLINPHTSFYFRSEVNCVSEEGLNVYGAVTWGQFFVYQGFNNNCGWMHTSTFADAVDQYLETVSRKGDKFYYKHDGKWKEIKEKSVSLKFKTDEGMKDKDFAVYWTHHGPVIGEADGKWKAIAMMDDPVHALEQSFMRTKATGYDSYKKVMELNGNSSNNTVFADTKGNIAYWHGNFVPKRDPSVNWNLPVDGSVSANDWKGFHTIDEIIQLKNSANGWIQNCNSTPFTAASDNSPKKENYPAYMAPDGQNYRAINADRVLKRESKFTLDKLIAAAYDPTLAAFEKLVPALITAYEAQATSEQKERFKDAIEVVKHWNKQYGTSSVGTTLAIYWARKLEGMMKVDQKVMADHKGDQVFYIEMMITTTSPDEKLQAFETTLGELERDFGTWNMAWGDLNRFQRPLGTITNPIFDDTKPSYPVASAPSLFGSLAAFGSRKPVGLKKYYGGVGNSFVAVVEFGPRIKAKSVVTGGSSSDPSSKHFNDQSLMYSKGQFKDVFFYKEDVVKNAERTYHPGE